MSSLRLLIDGQLVDGDQSMDIINPATGLAFASCPRASVKQLHDAVAAAKSAFPIWSRRPLRERQQALNKIADIIESQVSELSRLLTQEQGKPLNEAVIEIAGTAMFFRYFASQDLPPRILEETSTRRVEIHHCPLGVVGAIIPWNFPIFALTAKLAPALLMGNTVVAKPAPTTPLTTLKLGELIANVTPNGTFNIVSGDNDLGAALTVHPDVRKIAFTGSVATGRKVMASASATLKHITLELGGNDAAIVLADADPKHIAPKIFSSAFKNAGQVCVGIKRLYVHEDIYDEMCGELIELANKAVVGDGSLPQTEVGPIQNKVQYERVRELIEDARNWGKVIAGGTYPDGPGFFIRPTIVRDITEGTRLVDEEQFGPVLPVIKFRDLDDAMNLANASLFGLGGSVWSSNVDRAYEAACRIEAGTAWINKHGDVAFSIPFGGSKQSGLGVELGEEGIAEYTQLKVINVAL
jgi:acyl-CoA reductase-like NAD-dependent aldehyde dehydrogenase